jgi:hypothetical protein
LIREIKDRISKNNECAHAPTYTRSGYPVPSNDGASFNVAAAMNVENYRRLDALRRELGEDAPSLSSETSDKEPYNDPWALPTIADWH